VPAEGMAVACRRGILSGVLGIGLKNNYKWNNPTAGRQLGKITGSLSVGRIP